MRILFLTNHLQGTDGWSRYSLDLTGEIKKQGHEIEVVASSVLGTPLKYLANPLQFFFSARKVNKIIRLFQPDAIHFLVETYANILPFLKVGSARVFLTVHGSYCYVPNMLRAPLKKAISAFFYERALARLDGIIAVSNYTKNILLNLLPKSAKNQNIGAKIKVISNGINFHAHNPSSKEPRDENQVKKILFIGAIKPRKGLAEAVEGLKIYNGNYSKNFVYNIIGGFDPGDAYYLNLREKIKDYDLQSRIFFRGRVGDEERNNYYAEADLFLMLPIHYGRLFEGFGLVYLEANARGVPAICSSDCGAGEAIIPGKTGFVVNPNNPEEIAQKINDVLNNNSINPCDCIDWAEKNSVEYKAKVVLDFYQK